MATDTPNRVTLLSELPISKLVESYVKARDARAALKSEWVKQDEKYEEVMRELSSAMLASMNREGVKSSPTEHGTAYVYPQKSANIVDFEALWAWMQEKDRPDVLQKRLTLSVVDDWNTDNPKAPVPGVRLETVNTARVRK